MATLTEQQIEGYFYAKVVREFTHVITGGIYRPDMRPPDAHSEDIVVRFISAKADSVQTGFVAVNIYTNNTILPDGRSVRDFARLAEIEEHLAPFLASFKEDFSVSTDGTPYVEPINETNQSCLVVRLRFYRMTC